MIWELIKNAVAKNPITFILVGTIFINILFELIDLPTDARVIHWNGDEGVYLWWDGFFQKGYLIGFILLLMNLLNKSDLDKDVIKVYFMIDLIGYLSYRYQGWPEPKYFMITAFCVGVVLVVFIRLWKLKI